MSDVGRLEVFRMRASIHIDDPKTIRASNVENKQALKIAQFDNFETVSGSHLTRTRRRLASRMRRVTFEVRLAIVVQLASLGLKWNIGHREIRRQSARPRGN